MSARAPLPPAVRRRFWSYDEADLALAEHRPFLVGRLLEEGDADELRWLFRQVGRAAVADWVRSHGGSGLSRRGRAFWSLVLGVEAPGPRALAPELWPLA